jgi:LuxR family maltose regulon positive regulatory protein
MPMDRTHARLLLARAALALGEVDLARRHVDDAQRVADRVADIGAMREELAALQAQLGAVGAGAGDGSGQDFTERELEVIAMLPTSLTTREIGDELFLSRNTIKTYLRRVYLKLNASSREEAVIIAVELGLHTDRNTSSPIAASPG